MAPNNNSQQNASKSQTIAEVALKPNDRAGRDIFAINDGLRRLKEEYLKACQDNAGLESQTIVLSLVARRE